MDSLLENSGLQSPRDPWRTISGGSACRTPKGPACHSHQGMRRLHSLTDQQGTVSGFEVDPVASQIGIQSDCFLECCPNLLFHDSSFISVRSLNPRPYVSQRPLHLLKVPKIRSLGKDLRGLVTPSQLLVHLTLKNIFLRRGTR